MHFVPSLMTVSEAQKLVSRLRKVFRCCNKATDLDAVERIERTCLGIMGSLFCVTVLASALHFSFGGPIACLAFFGTFFVFRLLLRLRAVRGLFENTDAQFFAQLSEQEMFQGFDDFRELR